MRSGTRLCYGAVPNTENRKPALDARGDERFLSSALLPA